eukprot:gene12838-15073_t
MSKRKSKKEVEEEVEEEEVSQDEEEEEEEVKPKKKAAAKKEPAKKAAATKKAKTSSDSEPPSIDLGGKKRVSISEFKGTRYIGIREFYEKDGKWLPGAKGKTGLQVSVLSYGGSPLGGVYGDNDEKQAIDSVHYAIERGINFFDTSPYYGKTKSESVLGRALKDIPRDKFILGTKVGRYDVDTFNFSYDRIMSSVKESMERLGVDYLDVLQCHDIEFGDLNQVINESIPALLKLKSDGLVRHIGVTGFPLKALQKVAEARPDLDVVLSYSRHCLGNTSLNTLVPLLKNKNIGIINASFLNMGLLTERGPPAWHPAPPALLQCARDAAEHCKKRGSNISKLALQYTMLNPDIATHLVGMPLREQVDDNIATMQEPIDRQLLNEVLDIFKPVQDQSWSVGKPENN